MKLIASMGVIVLLFAVTSCHSTKKEPEKASETTPEQVASPPAPAPESVAFKELSGYFLNNSYELPSEVNLIVAQDSDQMRLDFGIAKTMKNQIDKVDFSANDVIAVAAQPTDHKTDIKIDKVEKIGDTLNVYVLIEEGVKQSFKITPFTIFTFPKNSDIKQVELYSGEQKKDSKPYKR